VKIAPRRIASRHSPRPASHTSAMSASSPGKSFVIVPSPSNRNASSRRSRASASSPPSASAIGSGSKCVRTDAPIATGASTSSQATVSPSRPPPARRAASCWPATRQSAMSTPNVQAIDAGSRPNTPASQSGSAASGGYSKPKSRYGSRPSCSSRAYCS
jgi:hypothetical protein